MPDVCSVCSRVSLKSILSVAIRSRLSGLFTFFIVSASRCWCCVQHIAHIKHEQTMIKRGSTTVSEYETYGWFFSSDVPKAAGQQDLSSTVTSKPSELSKGQSTIRSPSAFGRCIWNQRQPRMSCSLCCPWPCMHSMTWFSNLVMVVTLPCTNSRNASLFGLNGPPGMSRTSCICTCT